MLAPRVKAKERQDGDEGELLHYLIAVRAVDLLGATPPEGGLKPPRTNKKVPALTAWLVDWAIRQIKELIPPDWSLMVEVGMDYQYPLPRPVWVPVFEITGPIPADHEVREGMVCIRYVILSGHMDILSVSPDAKRMKGIDWKTGPVGADPADSNWQAATYLGLGKNAWDSIDQGEFTLAQPLIDEGATGIPRISSVSLTGDQLARLNDELAEQACRALETRYTTDSGVKQCRYCPMALTRPWDCPSLRAEETYMKAQIESGLLESLANAPDDAKLGDFVLSGRTLTAPVKEATELLHERLDSAGYIDAGCGKRITRKVQKGDITVTKPTEYFLALRELLQDDERIARVVTPSKDRVIDEIAEVHDIGKTAKKGDSATLRYETHLAPFTEQAERRILVIT